VTAERRLPYLGAAVLAEAVRAETYLLHECGVHPGQLTNRTPDELVAWAHDAGMTPISD
jgi:hypothetical protein